MFSVSHEAHSGPDSYMTARLHATTAKEEWEEKFPHWGVIIMIMRDEGRINVRRQERE